MRIADVMIRDVALVPPEATVQEAARMMAELDCGALPVGHDRAALDGIVTDRDLLVRVLARGLPPDSTPVGAVMSSDVQTCHPDDVIADIARSMGLRQIRRMPVMDDAGVLVGIVTLADIERLERGDPPL